MDLKRTQMILLDILRLVLNKNAPWIIETWFQWPMKSILKFKIVIPLLFLTKIWLKQPRKRYEHRHEWSTLKSQECQINEDFHKNFMSEFVNNKVSSSLKTNDSNKYCKVNFNDKLADLEFLSHTSQDGMDTSKLEYNYNS